MNGIDLAILGFGLLLLALGLALRKSENGRYVLKVGNFGWSIFGDVTQTGTVSNADIRTQPSKEAKHRDWIGWTLAIIGILLTLAEIFKFFG